MAKRRKVGVKLAEQKLAGARKRKNQAERDEKKALDELAAAQKRAVKRAVSCPPVRSRGRKRKPRIAEQKPVVSKNSKSKGNSSKSRSSKSNLSSKSFGKTTGKKGKSGKNGSSRKKGSRQSKGPKPKTTKSGTLS